VEIPATTSLKKFVRLVKQHSGFRLKQLTGSTAWQVSYYDHVLRNDEDLQTIADYIWLNPVEEGIVSDRSDYAWSGPPEVMDD
jgi:REP element-mobilizing transposase RayT